MNPEDIDNLAKIRLPQLLKSSTEISIKNLSDIVSSEVLVIESHTIIPHKLLRRFIQGRLIDFFNNPNNIPSGISYNKENGIFKYIIK